MHSLLSKRNKLHHNILCVIIWGLVLILIRASEITVNNEDELMKAFSLAEKNSSNELTITFNNVLIELPSNITVNTSVKKLNIVGKSKEASVLKFSDPSQGIYLYNLFYEQDQEIKFKNMTVIGRMEFFSIVNVKFEDFVLNGVAIFDKADRQIWNSGTPVYNMEYLQKQLVVTIYMTRMTYNAYTTTPHYCINIFGNVKIKDSEFYGHATCVNTIIDYRGEGVSEFIVSNSYFNGMHENKLINLFNSINAVFTDSTFENGFTEINGGAAMLLYFSAVEIKNCVFRNFFTPYYGGILYNHYPVSFYANHIDVYNTTALYAGSLSYIYSWFETDETIDINFFNVNVYGAGLVYDPFQIGALLLDLISIN
ncbi:hypothetical protein PIROE2DRAFT_10950 [Piromyces sp. E2]|nr:hypothetical protein PIROE2DRAFT_10950 [Piromyces sp. E2]|eukprot:OUM62690.1 hypothetical protein PIROE2DRAFT_10950 [Piromyces sp. E2]